MTLISPWIFLAIFVVVILLAMGALAITTIAALPTHRFSRPFGSHTDYDSGDCSAGDASASGAQEDLRVDRYMRGHHRDHLGGYGGHHSGGGRRASRSPRPRSRSAPSIPPTYIADPTSLRIIEKDLRLHPRTKSEAAVISIFESLTRQKFPTVMLVVGDQRFELDGYCENLKLAVEYQGPLHTKWTPSKESYEKYLARVLKDEEKKRICEHFGIHLIVIDTAQHGIGLRVYIESRLADLGLRERPANYTPEKVIAPFRNPQLESR